MTAEQEWRGFRILVTGGGGFLGSHLCHHLRGLGAEVHATSRASRSMDKSGTTWWQSDLTSLEEVRRIITAVRPDTIYHLAGSVGASPDRNLVLPTFQSLLVTTINVLTIATDLRSRRVILAGSLTEPRHSDPTPSSPYAAAKWAASGYARMFHALYGTPIVVLTPYMTYGPGQHPDKLIPSVITRVLKREVPQLASGHWEADWVYVDDIARAFILAAQKPGIEGKSFHLGSGHTSSVRGIVELLMTLMGSGIKPAFGALPDRPIEPICVADTSQAKQELGWKSEISLKEGLRQTIDWYAAKFHITTA